MSTSPSSSQTPEKATYSIIQEMQELRNALSRKKYGLDTVSDTASALAWAIDFTDSFVRRPHSFCDQS
jgi:hypothetical protein